MTDDPMTGAACICWSSVKRSNVIGLNTCPWTSASIHDPGADRVSKKGTPVFLMKYNCFLIAALGYAVILLRKLFLSRVHGGKVPKSIRSVLVRELPVASEKSLNGLFY